MPFSSDNCKKEIRSFIEGRPHATILDIGCGAGAYARMFPESKVTGVEIWQPYIEQYNLRHIYDELHVEDARKWDAGDKVFDIAIAGDVLEHMTSEEAQALVAKLKLCARWVVVSIPFNYPQDEWEGNPYERHVKDDWTHEEVVNIFGEPDWVSLNYPIGAYAWQGSAHKQDRLKIAVYAISKNEAHFVPRFCEAAKDADLIFIADTGSTDGLPDVARAHGAVVQDIRISPWRFDLARNAALALLPGDIDVAISLDIDEVLQPGWREEIERVWVKGTTTRLRYMFDWGAGIQFYYEKIHARNGYFWHHPCHEYPVADGRITEVWAQTDMLLAIHKPDPTKSRGQYLDLLALSVKEDPNCPRNAFYYARELSFHGQWEKSIEACESYLRLPGAIWANERCYAYRVMGRCHSEMGDVAAAERAFMLGASEAPNTREPWCELAALMYRQERWEESFAYAMRALKITDMAKVYTCDPAVWGAQPHDYVSIAAWRLGLKDIALQQAKIACEKEPDDLRLRSNLKYIEDNMAAITTEAA